MDIAAFFQQDWVKDLITLVSLLAAVLAWVAKLRWSKEYSDAKDAVISSKEEQIKTKQTHIELVERENNSLREQTPEKLLERYKIIQKQLEEMLERLGNELNSTKEELRTKENLLDNTNARETDLRKEIDVRENHLKKLRRELAEAQSAQVSAKRLSLLALDLGMGAFQQRMEKYDSAPAAEYFDQEDRYTPKPIELTVENMVEWFLENYKDPADGVPWDGEDKEYFYVYGGPYDATEELWAHFPDADEEDVQKAAAEIESDGTLDWVKQWQY